jgi:hypothetical protein
VETCPRLDHSESPLVVDMMVHFSKASELFEFGLCCQFDRPVDFYLPTEKFTTGG